MLKVDRQLTNDRTHTAYTELQKKKRSPTTIIAKESIMKERHITATATAHSFSFLSMFLGERK
jgi:hypothetical protein